jgi:hypothetical protein
MSDDLSREEISDAVDRAVAGLLDDAGVSSPPVDAVALAQRHLGLILRPKPDLTPEQRQFAAAREVGRVGKDDLLRRLDLDPEEQRRGLAGASLVNLFAERLLLPTPWFRDAARAAGFDLLALKERFATASHEAIAWRLLDLDEPCLITLVENGSVVRRRGNVARAGKGLSPPERRCLQQVQRSGRPCDLSEDGWRVQGWPIDPGGGKREVLRSVLEEM